MRKVKSRLALLLAVIMIAGSLQLPVFAVRRSGAGIPSGASAEAGVEDPGQVTETELLDLVPDSAGTGGTEPQDPVDTTWTVIFDANGGTFPGGETQISLDVEKGLAVQFNSEPLTTADRYFAGWKTQDGTLINDAYSFVPENDITLYAFWKDKKKVENISLNHHELTMSVGKTAALSATVLPEDAYDRSFTWKSGNPGVAAVNNNGKVTAAAKGTAVIKAAANDGSGVFAECKITVRQPVTSLTLNKTSLTVNKGATSTLSATAGPSDANNKTVKWTTSDSSVATVSSAGEVKGVKRGTATITATAADGSGKKATCSVTVKQLVTSLTLNKTALTLNNGKTATLTATVGDDTYTYEKSGVTFTNGQYYEINVKMLKTKSINAGSVEVPAGEHWLIKGTVDVTSNQITIRNGATVTLDGVNIKRDNRNGGVDSYCIKCEGNATIILKDGSTNTLTSLNDMPGEHDYPALWVGNKVDNNVTTLTIKGETAGTGALTVQSGTNSYCAGIGSGVGKPCGHIVIEGGFITATGGAYAAGIGSGDACGNITIKGGTIEATGGNYAPGIGSGYKGSCGAITIASTVSSVTATKGDGAPYSIGAGEQAVSCGTVKYDDRVMYDGSAWTTTPEHGNSYGGLKFAVSKTVYDGDTWTLTP